MTGTPADPIVQRKKKPLQTALGFESAGAARGPL